MVSVPRELCWGDGVGVLSGCNQAVKGSFFYKLLRSFCGTGRWLKAPFLGMWEKKTENKKSASYKHFFQSKRHHPPTAHPWQISKVWHRSRVSLCCYCVRSALLNKTSFGIHARSNRLLKKLWLSSLVSGTTEGTVFSFWALPSSCAKQN